MTEDRKYAPLAHRLGKVVKAPYEDEYQGKKSAVFGLSVQQSYEANDTLWVNVKVYLDESKPSSVKRFHQALALEKGDRVVVEGNWKEKQGTGKTFYDLTAFAIYRAVDVNVEQDDDDL